MKKTAIIFLFLAACAAPQALQAEYGDGGYAGAFLKLGAGARALGMGGAFTAVADDHSACIYNPAGVALVTGQEVGLSYALMSFDRRLSFVGFVTEIKPTGGVGLGWINAGDSQIQARDSDGRPAGDLSYSDNAVFFSFAQQVGGRGAIGIGMRYLYQKLADQTAKGYGIDAGARFRLVRTLWAGAVVQNINAKYTWKTKFWERETETEDEVPLVVRGGLSYRTMQEKLLVAADIGKNSEQEVDVYGGAEYRLNDQLALRAGLKDGELTAGAGFLRFVHKGNMQLDYTFLGNLAGPGSTHLFSLGYRF